MSSHVPTPGGCGLRPVLAIPRDLRFNRLVGSDYRFSTALLVRLLGVLLALVGLVLVLVAGAVVALDLSRTVLTVAVVGGVLAVVVGGFLVTRVATLVHFDETGYQVRFVRGAGVKQARWREVEDAVAATVSGHNCVVLRLRDGRTTTIPVGVLAADAATFMDDLRARLDKGHGYRRIS